MNHPHLKYSKTRCDGCSALAHLDACGVQHAGQVNNLVICYKWNESKQRQQSGFINVAEQLSAGQH